jgi:amidase
VRVTDVLAESAVDLAGAVAAGKVSARELVAAWAERIETVGRPLNAVVVLDHDRALAHAAAIDAAVVAGRPLGPLAGVPMTVKESFAVEGLPPELVGPAAAADAPAVAALRRAGAVILGKTNVPTLLADLQTDNPVYGRTVNPWDPDRSPGGSSGGSAAAIAAGLSALELGSDLAGSIRVPASWCGVYGLRPSNGWISKRGHLPWPLEGLSEPPTSVVGPIAHSVTDLAAAFEALAGVGRRAVPAPAGLRIAVWTAAPGAPTDTVTAGVLAGTRARLEDAGVRTEDFVAPFDAEPTLALGQRLIDIEIIHGLTEAGWEGVRAGPPGPMTQTVRTHLADQESRLRLTAAWDRAVADFDAVLCPATAVAALPHDTRPRDQRTVVIDGVAHPHDALGAWSVLASVAHQPSVTLPAAGVGLPVGLQLLGGFRGDARLLAVAAAVDEVVGGWRPPPGWG